MVNRDLPNYWRQTVAERASAAALYDRWSYTYENVPSVIGCQYTVVKSWNRGYS